MALGSFLLVYPIKIQVRNELLEEAKNISSLIYVIPVIWSLLWRQLTTKHICLYPTHAFHRLGDSPHGNQSTFSKYVPDVTIGEWFQLWIASEMNQSATTNWEIKKTFLKAQRPFILQGTFQLDQNSNMSSGKLLLK